MKTIISILLCLFIATFAFGEWSPTRELRSGGKLVDVGKCDLSGVCILSESFCPESKNILQKVGYMQKIKCDFGIIFIYNKEDNVYDYGGTFECYENEFDYCDIKERKKI